MDPLERLLAERAGERLVHRYAHLLDLGEADRVPELFAGRLGPVLGRCFLVYCPVPGQQPEPSGSGSWG